MLRNGIEKPVFAFLAGRTVYESYCSPTMYSESDYSLITRSFFCSEIASMGLLYVGKSVFGYESRLKFLCAGPCRVVCH